MSLLLQQCHWRESMAPPQLDGRADLIRPDTYPSTMGSRPTHLDVGAWRIGMRIDSLFPSQEPARAGRGEASNADLLQLPMFFQETLLASKRLPHSKENPSTQLLSLCPQGAPAHSLLSPRIIYGYNPCTHAISSAHQCTGFGSLADGMGQEYQHATRTDGEAYLRCSPIIGLPGRTPHQGQDPVAS